jgi:hypothetical protein
MSIPTTQTAPAPGYRWDPATRQYVAVGGPSVAAMPPATPVSSASLEMANAAMAKELAVNAGIAGAMGAAQLGMSFIPTAQDTRNKEELEKLERLEAQNKLGLSGAERRQLETELLNPARALARESRLNTEAAQASMGNSQSVANVTRAAREERRDVQDAAVKAGAIIGRTNLERADQQLRELEQRTAYQSNRAADRLGMGMRTLSQVAPMVGQAAAAQVQVREPTVEEIVARYPQLAGMDPEEIKALYRSNQAAAQQDAMSRLFSGYTGYNPNLPLSSGY